MLGWEERQELAGLGGWDQIERMAEEAASGPELRGGSGVVQVPIT